MSKNRNRAKLNKAINDKQYNRIMKNDGVYCIICVRRSGSYNGTCAPVSTRGRRWTPTWRYRMNRTWKHNRKTQWKS